MIGANICTENFKINSPLLFLSLSAGKGLLLLLASIGYSSAEVGFKLFKKLVINSLETGRILASLRCASLILNSFLAMRSLRFSAKSVFGKSSMKFPFSWAWANALLVIRLGVLTIC